MRKNLTIGLMLIISFFAISACAPSLPENKDTHINLNGTWSYSADGVDFTALVAADRIKVKMKLRDTEGLYWAGTFNSLVKGPTDVFSSADTELLKASMFGSQDKLKQFRYDNDGLTFTFGMANTEREIRLIKEKN